MGNCHHDPFFSEISKFIDNKYIIELQKQITPQQRAVIKKKGLKFNDFEDK